MKRKIVMQYYVLSALFNGAGMHIISAIYVSFLMKNGLGLLDVNLVNASFFLTLFICEIPTGAFADIFGRKTSFIAACGLMALSMALYGASKTLPGFILAEVLAAIAGTFKSGAFQAWLVDSLKHHGLDSDLKRIFSIEMTLNQLCGCLGAVAGAYLSAKDPCLPWYSGAIILSFLTLYANRVMREEYFVHQEFSWRKGLRAMKEVAASSMRYGVEHKAVRFILVITFIQILAVQALNMYWQPLFKSEGVAEKHLGWLFSCIMLCVATGSFVMSRIDMKGKEKRTFLTIQIATGFCIIVMASVAGLPAILTMFMIHEVLRGTWYPLKDSYLHERIPSSERATISSFCTMAPHIGGVFGLLLSGFVADSCGIKASWVMSGAILIVGALLVAKNGEHK